jgi:hypothetical protein
MFNLKRVQQRNFKDGNRSGGRKTYRKKENKSEICEGTKAQWI